MAPCRSWPPGEALDYRKRLNRGDQTASPGPDRAPDPIQSCTGANSGTYPDINLKNQRPQGASPPRPSGSSPPDPVPSASRRAADPAPGPVTSVTRSPASRSRPPSSTGVMNLRQSCVPTGSQRSRYSAPTLAERKERRGAVQRGQEQQPARLQQPGQGPREGRRIGHMLDHLQRGHHGETHALRQQAPPARPPGRPGAGPGRRHARPPRRSSRPAASRPSTSKPRRASASAARPAPQPTSSRRDAGAVRETPRHALGDPADPRRVHPVQRPHRPVRVPPAAASASNRATSATETLVLLIAGPPHARAYVCPASNRWQPPHPGRCRPPAPKSDVSGRSRGTVRPPPAMVPIMNIARRQLLMSRDQFFQWAQTQDGRYEFDGFQPMAMTGGNLPTQHYSAQRPLCAAPAPGWNGLPSFGS